MREYPGQQVSGATGRKGANASRSQRNRPIEHKQKVTLYDICVTSVHSVQSLSRVRLYATPWTAARQASLSITSSLSPLRLMSIESVMPSSPLILNNKSRLEQENGGVSWKKK